jgi:thiamine-phosphate pyrophosphorylase
VSPLADALAVLLVSDGRGDRGRLRALVADAVAGGVRAVQLREPMLSARDLAALADELRPLLERHAGLLFVNDRVDVAAAGHAHGAQVGHRSLRPAAARALLPAPLLLGASAHDRQQLDEAADAGCDFALLAPVWPTASKPGASGLGVAAAAALTAAARLPVLWLGGVTAARMAELGGLPAAARPRGVAAIAAICGAPDVRAAAAALVDAVRTLRARGS